MPSAPRFSTGGSTPTDAPPEHTLGNSLGPPSTCCRTPIVTLFGVSSSVAVLVPMTSPPRTASREFALDNPRTWFPRRSPTPRYRPRFLPSPRRSPRAWHRGSTEAQGASYYHRHRSWDRCDDHPRSPYRAERLPADCKRPRRPAEWMTNSRHGSVPLLRALPPDELRRRGSRGGRRLPRRISRPDPPRAGLRPLPLAPAPAGTPPASGLPLCTSP
jgi:hypothetical protein